MSQPTNGQIRILNSKINILSDEIVNSEQNQSLVLNQKEENKEIFGSDLYMFATGNLFVNDRPYSKKDISLVSGIYNYAQAITHRLMTTRGTMPGASSFGVPWDDYIGATYKDKNTVRRLLISDITEEIYKDSRTGEVLSVETNFSDPNVINVVCTITPVNFNTSFQVNVTVGE